MKNGTAVEQLETLVARTGPILRLRDAVRAGMPPRLFYSLVPAGKLVRLGRGLYRAVLPIPPGNPDLITVARTFPRGVICLLSALYHHGLTTQIPHEVYVALRQHDQAPRPLPPQPPVQVCWFSAKAHAAGVETVVLDGAPVQIYTAEKTLADMFKYRNKLGLDTAIEALRRYRERETHPRIDLILEHARVCRIERVMRPYMEALL